MRATPTRSLQRSTTNCPVLVRRTSLYVRSHEPTLLISRWRTTWPYMRVAPQKYSFKQPTTLLALIRLVADLWKRDDQNKNAMDIADAGARLYDKFVGFVEALESVGSHWTDGG